MTKTTMTAAALSGLLSFALPACAQTSALEQLLGTGDLPRIERIEHVRVVGTQNTGGSFAATPHVLAGVLQGLSALIKSSDEWAFPKNAYAQAFASEYHNLLGEMSALSKYFEFKAAKGEVASINSWLAGKGFSIQLQPIGPNDLAAGALMDIPVTWKIEGKSRDVRLADGALVPGAYLPKDAASFYLAGETEVAKVETRTGELVCMAQVSRPAGDKDPVSLLKVAGELSRKATRRIGADGLLFPKVKFSHKDEQVPLVGATMGGWNVSQFLLEQKFEMDHLGARASAAAAGSATRSISMPMKINGSFLVWFEVEGKIPFAAYITREHMKDPKAGN